MLKVKDLIEELSKQDPEAVVYVWANHGQTNQRLAYVDNGYFPNLDYYQEDSLKDEDEFLDSIGFDPDDFESDEDREDAIEEAIVDNGFKVVVLS